MPGRSGCMLWARGSAVARARARARRHGGMSCARSRAHVREPTLRHAARGAQRASAPEPRQARFSQCKRISARVARRWCSIGGRQELGAPPRCAAAWARSLLRCDSAIRAVARGWFSAEPQASIPTSAGTARSRATSPSPWIRTSPCTRTGMRPRLQTCSSHAGCHRSGFACRSGHLGRRRRLRHVRMCARGAGDTRPSSQRPLRGSVARVTRGREAVGARVRGSSTASGAPQPVDASVLS